MAMFVCFSSKLTLWARHIHMPTIHKHSQKRPWAGSHAVLVGTVCQWLRHWNHMIILFSPPELQVHRTGWLTFLHENSLFSDSPFDFRGHVTFVYKTRNYHKSYFTRQFFIKISTWKPFKKNNMLNIKAVQHLCFISPLIDPIIGYSSWNTILQSVADVKNQSSTWLSKLRS